MQNCQSLPLVLEKRTNFVGVAANCCDAFHSKIEWLRREAGLLQERHNKAPETTVHMEANIVSLGELSKLNDIVLTAVWEVDSGTHDLEICHGELELPQKHSASKTMIVFGFLRRMSAASK